MRVVPLLISTIALVAASCGRAAPTTAPRPSINWTHSFGAGAEVLFADEEYVVATIPPPAASATSSASSGAPPKQLLLQLWSVMGRVPVWTQRDPCPGDFTPPDFPPSIDVLHRPFAVRRTSPATLTYLCGVLDAAAPYPYVFVTIVHRVDLSSGNVTFSREVDSSVPSLGKELEKHNVALSATGASVDMAYCLPTYDPSCVTGAGVVQQFTDPGFYNGGSVFGSTFALYREDPEAQDYPLAGVQFYDAASGVRGHVVKTPRVFSNLVTVGNGRYTVGLTRDRHAAGTGVRAVVVDLQLQTATVAAELTGLDVALPLSSLQDMEISAVVAANGTVVVVGVIANGYNESAWLRGYHVPLLSTTPSSAPASGVPVVQPAFVVKLAAPATPGSTSDPTGSRTACNGAGGRLLCAVSISDSPRMSQVATALTVVKAATGEVELASALPGNMWPVNVITVAEAGSLVLLSGMRSPLFTDPASGAIGQAPFQSSVVAYDTTAGQVGWAEEGALLMGGGTLGMALPVVLAGTGRCVVVARASGQQVDCVSLPS